MSAHLCPKCQQPNSCACASDARAFAKACDSNEGTEIKSCWCFTVDIPQTLVDQYQSKSQCLCACCIEAEQQKLAKN